MMECLIDEASAATPVLSLDENDLAVWLESQSPSVRSWVEANGFKAAAGDICFLPGQEGAVDLVLYGLATIPDAWSFAALAAKLPAGTYRLTEERLTSRQLTQAVVAWTLSLHTFTRYKTSPTDTDKRPLLVWPNGADRAAAERLVRATVLVRDLINTPAADLGPEELCRAVCDAVSPFGADVVEIVGPELVSQNYPMIFAVGQAASRLPRLIDVRWGDPEAPKLTLVGKGVCFDSGGLDLKSASNMKIMKKDMGGAAHALALAVMIMSSELPVRLRLLIPAVENAVSGSAFRPMDILKSRKGVTVEVGNTDAEGRLVLADALYEASTEEPALLIDCATLTGAARVALGAELPALFCNDDALADALLERGTQEGDPLWRLPLWAGYRPLLDSKLADLNNAPDTGFGGAITAALFLREFIGDCPSWIHIDMLAWNNAARPGRPEGGEAMTLRALFGLIEERFPR